MSQVLPFFVWPVVLVVAWTVAHFCFFRPIIKQIADTTGTTAALASPRVPRSRKIMLWLDGQKTLLASVGLSIFTMLKALGDVLSQNTDLLDTIKDNFPWASFVSADAALRIVGFCLIGITALHLWGKFTAAKAAPIGPPPP